MFVVNKGRRMQCAHLLVFISAAISVSADPVTIHVKKTVIVDTTIIANGTTTKERVENIVNEVKKEVSMSGEAGLPAIESPEAKKGLFDCSDLPAYSPSGVYSINTEHGSVEVFCDMTTDGGRWTVIQNNNISSTLVMDKSWRGYRDGFGKIKEVFWLGNEQISYMTTRRVYQLRVDMTDTEGSRLFAKYFLFVVLPEHLRFRLKVDGYLSGDAGFAGNDLLHHEGNSFSTHDKYSGPSHGCPVTHKSGWWWGKTCNGVDLNSRFPRWTNTQLQTTEMKIRPTHL